MSWPLLYPRVRGGVLDPVQPKRAPGVFSAYRKVQEEKGRSASSSTFSPFSLSPFPHCNRQILFRAELARGAAHGGDSLYLLFLQLPGSWILCELLPTDWARDGSLIGFLILPSVVVALNFDGASQVRLPFDSCGCRGSRLFSFLPSWAIHSWIVLDSLDWEERR